MYPPKISCKLGKRFLEVERRIAEASLRAFSASQLAQPEGGLLLKLMPHQLPLMALLKITSIKTTSGKRAKRRH